MGKKLTTKEIIDRFRNIHGNRYDYSKVEYTGYNNNVNIICPKHGEFFQRVDVHLIGTGCPKCKLILRFKNITREKFIEIVQKTHNNYYDYSNLKWKNINTPINIICPNHAKFTQPPLQHLSGLGCPECYKLKKFLEEANRIHNNQYDYSNVTHINNYDKILIICKKHGAFYQNPYSHLNGHACSWCSNRPRYNTKTFIQKSKKIHNNKYNYSKTNYIDCFTKITIICAEHGEFLQSPCSHVNGVGCPKCGGHFKLTFEDFIQRAKEIHGNKYDYSKVQYINNQTKVTIVCPKHGEFKQTPSLHINGSGCLICSGVKKSTRIEFIEKARKIHGNKYNYSKVEYKNNKVKVIIICPEHGEFEQTPNSHLHGYGCLDCSGKKVLTTEEFIKRAKIVHNNKYDYSKVRYKNSKAKVIIICPEHGEFKQTANGHLFGAGCKKCVSSISYKSQKWLDKIGVPKNNREISITLDSHTFFVDGFDKNKKIVYEFYGDFWHGNPKIYDFNDINPVNKLTFGQLYENTMKREKILKKAGFKIVFIWESDFT